MLRFIMHAIPRPNVKRSGKYGGMMVALLLLLISPQVGWAQETPSPYGNRNEASAADRGFYFPPSIQVTDVTLENYQTEATEIAGVFTARNDEEETVGDVWYRVELLDQLGTATAENPVIEDDAVVYDSQIVKADLAFAAGEVKHVPFQYDVPVVPAGTYRIRIQLTNSQGRDMGWFDQEAQLGTAEAGFAFIEAGAIESDEYPGQLLAPLSGPNVNPESTIKLNASIKNTGAKILKGIPTVEVYEFNETGTPVALTSGAEITLAAGASQTMTNAIVVSNKPGVYMGILSVQSADENTIGSTIAKYRWIVRGEAGQVISARITDLKVGKGETMGIMVDYTGSPDAETVTNGQLWIQVSDQSGVAGELNVSDDIVLSDSVNSGEALIQLQRNLVNNPMISVTLKNQSGNVLDEYSFEVPVDPSMLKATAASESAAAMQTWLNWKVAGVVALVIILIGLIMVAKKQRKNQAKNNMMPPLAGIFVLVGAGVWLTLNWANAAGQGINVFSPISSKEYHSDWRSLGSSPVVELFINQPTHDNEAGTYARDAVPLSFRVSWAVCENRMAGTTVLAHYLKEGGKISDFQPPSDKTYVKVSENSWGQDECPSAYRCITSTTYTAPNGINLTELLPSVNDTTLRLLALWDWNAENNGMPEWEEKTNDSEVGYDSWFINDGMAHAVNIWLNFLAMPACSDTIDNEGDGAIDCEDSGCYPDDIMVEGECDPEDTDENSAPEAVITTSGDKVGETVSLDGSQSKDDKGITSFAWNVLDPDGNAVTVTNANQALASFVPTKAGEHIVTLTVGDGELYSSAIARVTISDTANVGNETPVPVMKVDGTVTQGPGIFSGDTQIVWKDEVDSLMSLDASSSYDPDGGDLLYRWKVQVENCRGRYINPFGTVAVAQQPVQNLSLPDGSYGVRLVVTDNDGATAFVCRNVTVATRDTSENNSTPLAKITTTGNTINVPVNMDGSESYDPDGQIAAYNWTVIDRQGQAVAVTGANQATANFTPTTTGTHTVTLTVTDNQGKTAEAKAWVDVQAVGGGQNNSTPIAVMWVDGVKSSGADEAQSIKLSADGDTVSLDGSESYDPDGDILAYQWNIQAGSCTGDYLDTEAEQTTLFGNTTNDNLAKTAATLAAGNYGIRLVVMDSLTSATICQNVTVSIGGAGDDDPTTPETTATATPTATATATVTPTPTTTLAPTSTTAPVDGLAACNDGADNDGDGLVDCADPGCYWSQESGYSTSCDPNDTDETNAGVLPSAIIER